VMRAFGGLLYLAGFVVMLWNVGQTLAGKVREEAPMTETPHDPVADRPIPGAAAAVPAVPAE